MQLWELGMIVGAVFGVAFGVWQEFLRVAKHLNGLKDDYRRLEEELKDLRKRVYRLEDDAN
jgi:hypothetical protein